MANPTAIASGASTSDLLTALKNVVTAINNQTQTTLIINGLSNSGDLTGSTLLKTGSGRLANVIVSVGGSGTGSIYDTTNTGSPTNKIFVVSTTIGNYSANMPFQNGLVAVPGSGQTITVSYS